MTQAVEPCLGPMIWFSVGVPEDAAILQCAACDHLTVTRNWSEARHTDTPLLREGFG